LGQALYIRRRDCGTFDRSPNTGNSTNFRNVNTDGSSNNNNASNSNGVCLGLCTYRGKKPQSDKVTPRGEIRTFAEGELAP